MRKFFGVVGLLFCVLLASCSFNNFSGKNGSLEFSISKNDIAQLASRSAFRAGEGDETEIQELLFFVQIKGSKGYYAYKSQTVGIEVPKEKKEISNKENSDYNESVDEDFDYSEESINILQSPLNDAKIVFEKIPVNQTYTVMFDMLVRQVLNDEQEKQDIPEGKTVPEYNQELQELQSLYAYHICSGKTKNVTVTANQTNQVNVDAVLNVKELVSLKIEYADGTNKVISNDLDDETNYEDSYVSLTKKGNELYQTKIHWDNMGRVTSELKKVEDISYVLSDDSNFTDSWVKYMLYCMAFNYTTDSKESPKSSFIKQDLTFTDGVCSLKDFLLKYDNCSPELLMLDSNGFTFAIEIPLFSLYYNPIEESEINDPDNSTSITEKKQGSLLSSINQGAVSEEGGTNAQPLSFAKRNDTLRYIKEVSLNEVLGDKTLSTDDTVVFVMKVVSVNEKPLTFDKFYYELQSEDWASLTDTNLYAGNQCINVDNSSIPDSGYYTFVMPLNFIQNPSDYNRVLFFFDGQAGATEEYQTLTVTSLDYYIFPASTHSFVFSLGKNWDGQTNREYPYRYEFKQPLRDVFGNEFDFKGGETVSVYLTGSVFAYTGSTSTSSRLFTSTRPFTGEIYDGAVYTSSVNTDWESFHPLSNTQGTSTGNVTSLTITDGVLGNNGTYAFVNIQQPYFDKEETVSVDDLPPHNYQFQCVSVCEDPSVLLVIEGFGMFTTAD